MIQITTFFAWLLGPRADSRTFFQNGEQDWKSHLGTPPGPRGGAHVGERREAPNGDRSGVPSVGIFQCWPKNTAKTGHPKCFGQIWSKNFKDSMFILEFYVFLWLLKKRVNGAYIQKCLPQGPVMSPIVLSPVTLKISRDTSILKIITGYFSCHGCFSSNCHGYVQFATG